jgi:hypothetical protein
LIIHIGNDVDAQGAKLPLRWAHRHTWCVLGCLEITCQPGKIAWRRVVGWRLRGFQAGAASHGARILLTLLELGGRCEVDVIGGDWP